MREWLEKIKPSPWLSKKLLMAAILIAVGVASFCWGRRHAGATPPGSIEAAANAPSAANGTRVVAYVNNQPVFREELGEYLIARFGADRLTFLVNRKIVEMECRKYNITVTDEEVQARFRHELNTFGGAVPLTEENFVNNILKRFNKTLFEWKEDVIRPKIMMEKLVGNSVKISNKDVEEGFEARYGPKVDCRMIVVEKNNRTLTDKIWGDASKSKEAFLAEAAKQSIPNLANARGQVPPIHKHFGDKALEDAAFRLKVGDISGPIPMQDGSCVILMCENHLPENRTVKIADEWQRISREMTELRVAQRIPEVFTELSKAANPVYLLKNEGSMTSVPMPRLQPPAGQAPVQLSPDTLPAPRGLAPPSLTPAKN